MIKKNRLKSVAHALTIGGVAIATAGCNAERGPVSLGVEAGPIAQYAAASDVASNMELGARPEQAASSAAQAADAEHPTHAEERHFAIYNRYRAIVESSGSGGSGGQTCAGAAQQIVIPGRSLPDIEQITCPADVSGK